MSLRIRLTLLTATLIAVATSVLGVVIYVNAGSIQLERVDEAMYSEIAQARIRSLAENPRPPQNDVYVSIALGRLNRDGTITPLRDAGTPDNPIPLPPLSRAQIDEATIAPITVSGDPDFRVVVRRQGQGLATVIAAAPLTAMDETLSSLAGAILVSVIAVTAAGAVTSWLMVRRAFRPMRAMVTSAATIADGDTEHRLPQAPPGTEIGDLSQSMNQMIDSLANAVAAAAASEDRLRTFISDASHEIRTPLTVIRGYSELVATRSADLSDVDRAALNRIEAESKRLDRLVTQLLVLEGRGAARPEDVADLDVAPFVREACADLMALDPDRDITVEAPSLTVRVSPDDLRHLLSNVAQNLARHTPEGSPVQVSVLASGEHVTIRVDDAGPGILPARRASLLDRSGRRHQSSSTEGFGLGMRIMVDVAERNGGALELGESPLGGLRLEIRLPSAPTHRADRPVD